MVDGKESELAFYKRTKADLEAQLAKTQQALSEREATLLEVNQSLEYSVNRAANLEQQINEALEKGLEYQKIAHHENNEADKTRIELQEALERESALNAKVEELEKMIREFYVLLCVEGIINPEKSIQVIKDTIKAWDGRFDVKDKDDATN